MGQKKYIGVFDSGFGGLDILRGIIKTLPQYDYIYLGDTARTPYGTRSPEIVYKFTKEAVDFLFAKNCTLVLLACNTASSDALRKIQKKDIPRLYPDKKILGVLIPAAEEAVLRTKNKRVGVIATDGTVKSGAFVRELKKLDPQIRVFQKGCPLLVPLVEAGEQNTEAARLILQNYLRPLIAKNIDTLILGCTHYGILKRAVQNIVGSRVHVVSEAETVPQKLKAYLAKHDEREKQIGKNGKIHFYTTDLSPKFQRLGSRFFGKPIHAQKITLAARQ
ncbi:MAG: glutamate racemase [Parcubacteria group bacterium]|nr:glutamate racemase [Parcubacteria group bacterium]MBI2175596.1 glutamate racemase [Parcubacteria group bacterium]